MNWTDYQPRPDGPGLDLRQRADRGAVPERHSLGAKSFDPKTTDRSVVATSRRPNAPATTRPTPAAPARAATRARTAARASCTCAGTCRSSPGGSSPWPRTPAATWSPATRSTRPGAPDALKLTPDKTRAAGRRQVAGLPHRPVVDAHGVEVPDADNTIHISVRGAGTFAGRRQRQGGRRRGLQVAHARRLQRQAAGDRAVRHAARPDPRDASPRRACAAPRSRCTRAGTRRGRSRRGPATSYPAAPRAALAQPRRRPPTRASPAACSRASARTSA